MSVLTAERFLVTDLRTRMQIIPNKDSRLILLYVTYELVLYSWRHGLIDCDLGSKFVIRWLSMYCGYDSKQQVVSFYKIPKMS